MTSHVFWPERHRQQLVIGWNLVVFCLAIGALMIDERHGFGIAVTQIPLIFAAYIAINEATRRHGELKLEQRFARFPTSFEVVNRDDQETFVSVELGTGETLIVTVPDADYRPADDDGETVMRLLHPEIYA